MADLAKDVRLAVETGKVAIGSNETIDAISKDSAKLVVIAARGKKDLISDIEHICGVAGVKIAKYHGNSLDLGTVCGKPYSINALAIIEPGDSNILKESY